MVAEAARRPLLTYAAASHCSGRPHVAITTGAPAVPTRAASASARPGFAANWNELKPVTTSNDRSAKGSCSISPTTSSAAGVRSRAISIIGAAASRPLTWRPAAPRASGTAPLRTPRRAAGFRPRSRARQERPRRARHLRLLGGEVAGSLSPELSLDGAGAVCVACVVVMATVWAPRGQASSPDRAIFSMSGYVARRVSREAPLSGDRDRGRSRRDAELGEDVRHMPVNGVFADHEPFGDHGFERPSATSLRTSSSRAVSRHRLEGTVGAPRRASSLAASLAARRHRVPRARSWPYPPRPRLRPDGHLRPAPVPARGAPGPARTPPRRGDADRQRPRTGAPLAQRHPRPLRSRRRRARSAACSESFPTAVAISCKPGALRGPARGRPSRSRSSPAAHTLPRPRSSAPRPRLRT